MLLSCPVLKWLHPLIWPVVFNPNTISNPPSGVLGEASVICRQFIEVGILYAFRSMRRSSLKYSIIR